MLQHRFFLFNPHLIKDRLGIFMKQEDYNYKKLKPKKVEPMIHPLKQLIGTPQPDRLHIDPKVYNSTHT
jgi:hypothetical protein